MRLGPSEIERWLAAEPVDVADLTAEVSRRERMLFGTLRARTAGEGDEAGLRDLYANAPKEIGAWEVTVERSPDPFAQFRLQEHPFVRLVEDRGVVLAASAISFRNTLVAGRRIAVRCGTAFRV